jgi:CRP-like cAMP-binding protein
MAENLLLQQLSPLLQERLKHQMTTVALQSGETVSRPGLSPTRVYFPLDAVVSLVTEVESGGSVEAGMVGFEGFVGLPVFFGGGVSNTRAVTQIAGTALALPSEVFRHHLQEDAFREVMGRYAETIYALANQSIACQAFHSVEQRLSRWLLMVQDRTRTTTLNLTQEFLASMLGVQRPTVTVTARLLQAAGLIAYRHGKIVILDRESLEASACECYRAIASIDRTREAGLDR